MAEAKTKPTKQSVKRFLESVPDEQTRKDCEAIAGIMSEATGCTPVMWGPNIVGFGTHRFKYAGGREADWPLTGFAPRKQNLTLYILGGFDKYEELLKKLGKHRHAKSCLYIKRLSDVDQPTLKKLVSASVKHMKKS